MGTKKAEPNVKVLSLSTLSYLPLTAHPPQSGFYPTIPLNQLQPRLPTAFSSQSQWSVFSSYFNPSSSYLDKVSHSLLFRNTSLLSLRVTHYLWMFFLYFKNTAVPQDALFSWFLCFRHTHLPE